MYLNRSVMEELIYGSEVGRRQTQDSPILPDVWLRYGSWADYEPGPGNVEPSEVPRHSNELLLTPYFGHTPGEVARELTRRFREQKADVRSMRIAYNQTYVALRLKFRDLLCGVLPMTSWWYDPVVTNLCRFAGVEPTSEETLLTDDLGQFLARRRSVIEQNLAHPGRQISKSLPQISSDLLWMMRLVGSVAFVLNADESRERMDQIPNPQQIVGGLISVFDAFSVELPAGGEKPDTSVERLVYVVNMNRSARLAITRSTLAIKADAAERLFQIDCRGLAWGIIDSGVDASHPAFLRTSDFGDGKRDPRDENGYKNADFQWWNHTRVVRTYDFTRIRDLLNPSTLDPEAPPLKEILARLPKPKRDRFVAEELVEFRIRLERGRSVDWRLLEPLLDIPHDKYYERHRPSSDHGTHVAGILAADWPQRRDYNGVPLRGVCPGIKIYDLRVVDPSAPAADDDEFAVLAALQFVAYLNDQKDYYAIHGVNLSLAIAHEVANYACGRTPVCDECGRLVSTGVVCVAAAGNEGYLQYRTTAGPKPGYHTVSITDPGNAEMAITVGATHRFQPHTYGVSYFSSRGPTGDGRMKPDLVAPGEKIWAPTPNGGVDYKDGTSMAAPHVGGAAALLMARHNELVGNPARIKEILCATATDLGRERYFQGAGMLDVLRALQSV